MAGGCVFERLEGKKDGRRAISESDLFYSTVCHNHTETARLRRSLGNNSLKALPRPKPVAAAPPPPPPPPPAALAPALPVNNMRSAASTPPSSGASTPLRGVGASGKGAPPAPKPKPMVPPKIPSKPAAPSAGGRAIPPPAAATAAPANTGMGQLDLAAA